MSSQRIICEACGEKRNKPMHPEDVAMGFHRRRVNLLVKKPASHAITTYSDSEPTKHEELASIYCDDCGVPIPDGRKGVAVTMWRGKTEPEPWEHHYGQVL